MSTGKRRRLPLVSLHTGHAKGPPMELPIVTRPPTPTAVDIGVEGRDDASVVKVELDYVANLLLVEMLKDNAKDVTQALKQIYHLFLADDIANNEDPAVKRLNEALDLGSITLMAITMRKWPNDHDIQMHACECLRVLMFTANRNGIASGRLAMTKSGGIEAVVGAMKKFPSSRDLQFGAITALTFTCMIDCASDPIAVIDGVRRLIEDMGCIEHVANAMHRFPGNVDFQCNSCDFFWVVLCRLDNYRDRMIKAGIASAAVSLLEKHFDNDIAKESASGFLSKLFPERLY